MRKNHGVWSEVSFALLKNQNEWLAAWVDRRLHDNELIQKTGLRQVTGTLPAEADPLAKA